MSDLDDRILFREQQRALLEGDDVDESRPMDEDLRRLGPSDFDVMQEGRGLSGKVSERNAKWDALVHRAPFTRGNPPSILQGTLGNQATVFSGDAKNPGAAIDVANWAGDDAETMPVTVSFGVAPGVNLVAAANGQELFAPYGIIQFGTRAAQLRAEVDIVQNTQLTISASSVRLQVALEPVEAGAIQQSAILTGMLSFRSITHGTAPTRTRYILIDAHASQIVQVPPFAKNVVFWRNPIVEPFTLHFLNAGGDDRYDFPVVANATMLTPIPLSGEITQIQVESTGGFGFGGGSSLIFQLGL